MKASTALLRMFVLLHVSAQFLIAISSPPTPVLQEKTEHEIALRNRNFVETLESKEIGIARRLVEGLALLRQGKPVEALVKLSPTLLPGSPSYQIKYGDRETRNFHELLLDILEHALPSVRERFLERMNKDAARIFPTLRGDHEGLADFLQAFPGTTSAARARLEIVDTELEAGDWVAASVHMQRLTAQERKAREATLRALATADLAGSPWPYPLGQKTGEAGKGASKLAIAVPKMLRQWSEKRRCITEVARGVVGRDADGNEFCIFQDPLHLFRVDGAKSLYATQSVDLHELTGLEPGFAGPPAPSLLGHRLYFVHGGGSRATRIFPRRATPGVPGLFAMECGSAKKAEFDIVWRWSPDKDPAVIAGKLPFTVKARLHPYCLAIGKRVYALLSERKERLDIRVHLVCFAVAAGSAIDGQSFGKLLWSRFLAKGSPLTSQLLESRQEELDRGLHRPAAPIFAEGRIIVSTGLGILCAVDPVKGHLIWTLRTARLRATGEREQKWLEGRLAAQAGDLWFTPSDSTWLYRLKIYPGQGDLLQSLPLEKRSLTRFLGIASPTLSAVFMRGEPDRGEGIFQEIRPLRLLLRADGDRPDRYDAPPLQEGEFLVAQALLTQKSLILPTNKSIYWLDLEKDLFYEHAFELRAQHAGGLGPAVPFEGAVLFGGRLGAMLWK